MIAIEMADAAKIGHMIQPLASSSSSTRRLRKSGIPAATAHLTASSVKENHDAITAAVDALAALPADKRAGVLAVVEAREKAAAMLAELRS